MVNTVDGAKAHIERIYKEKYEKASYDLANSINVIVSDVLQGRLPFEFIQNADDARKNIDEGILSFTLNENTLIISHNGKPFSYEDVEKICSIAQQKYLDKIEDDQMIGQKGIGIKVAFSEADQMIVYSHPYCFRFQEKYSAWKEATREEPYPWQITPIWTDPSKLSQELDSKQVHFVLNLRRPDEIREQLQKLSNTPRILLFLNRIRRISVLGTDLFMEMCSNGMMRKLYVNGKLQSCWRYQLDTVSIPTDLKSMLKQMGSFECPDKLKKDDYQLKLSFAFRFKNNQGLVKAENTVLSCYLPTTVNCKLPFLVNGDFLLEASRERLKKNAWNIFVLQQIAKRHFYWLSQFALDPSLRNGVLNVLGPPTVDHELAKDYASAYEKCRKKVRFIPSQQDPSQLLLLTNCRLDTTGFFRFFLHQSLKEETLPILVDDQLDNVNILDTVHKVSIWTYDKIIENSKCYLKSQPKLLRLFLEFFMNNWDKMTKDEQSKFREECMIPDKGGSVSCIKSFFLTSTNSVSYPDCLKIPLFPQDCQTDTLKNWLHERIRIEYLSSKKIIEGPLVDFVRDGKLDSSNTISVMRFLYTALLNKKITEFEIAKLFPNMEILSGKGKMRFAGGCYLADAYSPTFPLENLIKDRPDLFTSTQYIDIAGKDKIQVWKTLFLKLGVQDQVTVKNPSAPQISQLKFQNVSHLDSYLSYLYRDLGTSPLKKKADNNSHTLPNFVYVPFMEFLHIEAYAHHFWAEVLDNWDAIHSLCSKPQYKTSNPKSSPLAISYIQYILQERPLCNTSSKSLPGKELYAPHLKELVEEYFPVVNTSHPMPLEKARFFGFKTQVSPLHCLSIFDRMRKSDTVDIAKYTQLLQHLVEGFGQLTNDEKAQIRKREKFVIAENGSWQPCNEKLKCSIIPGLLPRFDREDRVKIVMPLNIMEQLSTIMGFGTISLTQDPINVAGAEEDKTFTSDLHKRLPLIALCEALSLGKDPRLILNSLIKLAHSLRIFQAKKIPLSHDDEDATDILLFQNTIYYQGRITGKKVKLSRKLCEYFSLSQPMKKLLPEILSLKETTVVGKDKGISDFLRERGIDPALFHELKNENYSTPEMDNLPADSSQEDIPDTTVSDEKDILNGLRRLNIGDIRPQKSPAKRALLQDKEQSPSISSDESFSDDGIRDLVIQKKIRSPQSSQGSSGKKKGGSHVPNELTAEIGRYGEAFALKQLVRQYEEKYKCSAQEITKGDYKLVKNVIEFRIKWVNYQEERYEPYDIELIKKKDDELLYKRPVEIKTSTGNKAHFFMSENEWKIMHNDPKYRLYFVAGAKSPDEKMYRIRQPSVWIKDANVKEHKKYEITATIDNTSKKTGVSRIFHPPTKRTSSENFNSIPCFEEKAGKFSEQEIAQYLWLNPSIYISTEMIQKVNEVAIYLKERGFELRGIQADGNCFCNAFLKSYKTLYKNIPVLDTQENKIFYLRSVIASQYATTPKGSTDKIRIQEIQKDGEWLTASDEGDLLAKALSIPIRIVTVNKDQNGCGIIDMLTFTKKEKDQQEWDTINKSEEPKDYIFIVDLGGHFVYAQPIFAEKK